MDTTPRQDWQLQAQPGRDGAPLRLRLLHRGAPVDLAAAFDALAEDADCRTAFSAGLAAAPFAAFRWECPPLTTAALAQACECVVIDSPELARPADPSAFAPHLDKAAKQPTACFANLGGDASLVVPTPQGDHAAYAHLADFIRQAPAAQRDALWRGVGEAVRAQLGERPLWLNTAGDGVPWLHVRLDARPKYYRHTPYRQPIG